MDLFEQAVCFATEAHAGTLRKGTQLPYILHPMEAAVIVATMTVDREIMAAAVLHDVLEDTAVTAEELAARFGQRVAHLVSLESENKRRDYAPEDTWLIRKQETVESLRQETDPAVKMIALGDKLSNMRATARDSVLLGKSFWERFHVKDQTLQGWYYRSIGDALSELSPYVAWKEYQALVNQVFLFSDLPPIL